MHQITVSDIIPGFQHYGPRERQSPCSCGPQKLRPVLFLKLIITEMRYINYLLTSLLTYLLIYYQILERTRPPLAPLMLKYRDM